jgi:hypothetical protein
MGRDSLGRKVIDLVSPPLPVERWPKTLALLLFFIGALGGFSWLKSILDWPGPIAAAGLATLIAALAGMRRAGRSWRWTIGFARLACVSVHLLLLYVAVGLGWQLYWATAAWVRWLLPLVVLAGLLIERLRPSIRIPLALPVGLWILACLLGWGREDGRVRCDDYLRLQQESLVQMIAPTHSEMKQCVPGRSLWVSRYPRRVWEAPDGGRLVFTTQPGMFERLPDDPSLPEELYGSVCEIPTDGSRTPRCLGQGRAEGMVEVESLDRLIVAAWGDIAPGKRGAVYAFPRSGPLELLGKASFSENSVVMYYEPDGDSIGVFFDEAMTMERLRGSDLARLSDPVEAPFDPGDVFYDPRRHEGILCYSPGVLRPFNGRAAALVAFRGNPFVARALAPSDEYSWMWLSLVWGCQFDPEARKAYAAVTSLGLLLTLDYDTGRILNYRFVGWGLRSMVLDTERRRLYAASFLRGEVLSFDLDTGAKAGSWFVGRFVRGLRISRDSSSLFVASSLGVLRIPLGKGLR